MLCKYGAAGRNLTPFYISQLRKPQQSTYYLTY